MDAVITVLLAVLQLAFALLGVLMSLKSWRQRVERYAVALLLVLGPAGVGLVAWQAVRAQRGSEQNRRILLGDSEHPPYVAVISLPGNTRFIVLNSSDYPAYGIRIRLWDETARCVHEWKYPEMAAHTAFRDDNPWVLSDETARRRFVADITTRTGVVREELLLRRDANNQWTKAVRVRSGTRTLAEDVDSDWPRNAKGQVDWSAQ
jgi:hypothetical protein